MAPEDRLLLSFRLKALMGVYGLRPAEVCRRTRLDESYLSRVLDGKIRPTPPTVRRIVTAINAPYLEAETATTAG